jgi:transcriptional regulator with XRE-family HTH domain
MPSPACTFIGIELKVWRNRAELSLAEVALKLGRRESQLAEWENGHMWVPADVFAALTELYKVPVVEVLEVTSLAQNLLAQKSEAK